METTISQEEIDKAVIEATNVVESALSKVKESSITDKAARILTDYSKQIQGIIDNFLQNRGAITQQQLNELDEQVRLAKLKMLEEKSRNTNIKYITYAGIIIAVFGTLWFLSKKNKA